MPKKPISPIRVCGKVAYVPLTRGFEAIIDASDVPLVCDYNWFAQVIKGHDLVYAVRGAIQDGKKMTIGMHRQIIQPKNGFDVDHSNGNGLDNRRCNIREATRSQNMHNKRMQHNNTSGFKGVHWHKNKKKWDANIKLNDKRTYLGSFDTAELAAEAYEAAAKRMHLDFALRS